MASAEKKDFFDEIIESLRACESGSETAYVSKDVLLEFYRPVQRKMTAAKKVPPASSIASSIRQAVRTPVSVPPSSLPAKNISPVPSTDGMEKPEAADVSTMDWAALKKEVSICSRCPLCRSRRNTVFGDGNESAELMFIGEGPGADEDARGLPFVGKAGELLTKMILAMGYQRREVYIGNIVKCRPPNNRTPEDPESAACLPYIRRQIELVAPKAIVLLGATPLKGLFGLTGITRLRGRFLDYNGIPAMPTFHPAYLLRNPGAKMDVWKDLQQVMRLLGKTPPPRTQ